MQFQNIKLIFMFILILDIYISSYKYVYQQNSFWIAETLPKRFLESDKRKIWFMSKLTMRQGGKQKAL